MTHPTTPAAVLDRAADLIDDRGLLCEDYYRSPGGPLCTRSAIWVAALGTDFDMTYPGDLTPGAGYRVNRPVTPEDRDRAELFRQTYLAFTSYVRGEPARASFVGIIDWSDTNDQETVVRTLRDAAATLRAETAEDV